MRKTMKLRRFLPLVVLISLAFVAGGTDFLSEAIRVQVIEAMKEFLLGFKPMLGNIYLGLVVLSLLFALAHPIRLGIMKFLNLSGANERGRKLVLRATNLIYWVAMIVIGVSFIAPGFIANMMVGFGVFSAALVISLKGLANDLLSGVQLSFSNKFKVGDYVEIVGLAGVKGLVQDVGYVSTTIHNPDTPEDDTIVVPNRELWNRAVKSMPSEQRPGQATES